VTGVRPVVGGRRPGRGTRQLPGAAAANGPVGPTAVLEGRPGRIASGRGAVAA